MASNGRVVALQWNKPRNKAREYIQCVTLLRPRPRRLHTRRPRSSPPTRKTEGRRRGGWPARGLWRSLINIISGRRARCRGESAREKKATDGSNGVTGVTAVGDSKWGYAGAIRDQTPLPLPLPPLRTDVAGVVVVVVATTTTAVDAATTAAVAAAVEREREKERNVDPSRASSRVFSSPTEHTTATRQNHARLGSKRRGYRVRGIATLLSAIRSRRDAPETTPRVHRDTVTRG